jgi:hypothetical protein
MPPRARRANNGKKEELVQKSSEMAHRCEGRTSVLKRRHGLQRVRYKGPDGMKRWVGFGVIADNIIHIGSHLAEQDSN